MNEMKLRPFYPDDAVKILSWCKDKHTFRHWSADRYEDFPAWPEEMMKNQIIIYQTEDGNKQISSLFENVSPRKDFSNFPGTKNHQLNLIQIFYLTKNFFPLQITIPW